MSQRLDEWLIWDAHVLVTAAEEDDGTKVVRVAGHFRSESGLADAGLAGNQYDPSLTVGRFLPILQQRLELETPT